MARLGVIVPLVVLAVGCGRLNFGNDVFTDASPADDSAGATDADALGPFCAGRVATLCIDFEDGTVGTWRSVEQTRATHAVGPDGAASTYALVAISEAIGAGAFAGASIEATAPGVAQRLVVSLDVRIDDVGTGDAVVVQAMFDDPAEYHGIEYVYVAPPGGSYLEEFRQPRPSGATQFDSWAIAAPSLPPQEWHRIELELDVRATPRALVRHDGVTVLDTALVGSVSGTPLVRVGLAYLGGPATSWTIREDNVLVVAD